MKILNIGSLNLDYVYTVPHFVAAGETLASTAREVFCGGKGLNQSIALARAGGQVLHAGAIGPEGGALERALTDAGVDTHLLLHREIPTGHAMIQVNMTGNNCILLYGGANRSLDRDYIDRVIGECEPGDILVMQNEVNLPLYMVERAYKAGMRVVLNPSPYNEELADIPFEKVAYLLLNETEGRQITDKSDPDAILSALRGSYPSLCVVLTLGENGAIYDDGHIRTRQPIFSVPVADTTAAGDTFTGYFVTAIANGSSPAEALRPASAASAISVSRKGASPSIPQKEEVAAFLATHH
ncbi:putative uncharacterized protein [Clostridium sp. CAG:448]|nr:putative uncharacterized protein [Clostridium sp. CAG:448]